MIEVVQRKTAPAPARRRGISTIALLVCVTTILCFLALSIDLGLLIQRHQQLKTASQAAALAAALELFSPRLSDDDTDRTELARLAAINFAAVNGVNGMALRLGANPLNAVNGDVVLGLVNPPELRARFSPQREPESPINAVVVRARHSQTGAPSAALFLSRLVGYSPADFYAESTAAVDHRIIGFRPVECSNIPMLPILVHCEPWAEPPEDDDDDEQSEKSSDERAAKRAAIDRFTVEPRQGVVVALPDGIPEFRLIIGGGENGQSGVNL